MDTEYNQLMKDVYKKRPKFSEIMIKLDQYRMSDEIRLLIQNVIRRMIYFEQDIEMWMIKDEDEGDTSDLEYHKGMIDATRRLIAIIENQYGPKEDDDQ